MTEVQLQDDPIYRALSYTWDLDRVRRRLRPRPRRTIVCNGKSLLVVENLYQALQHLASLPDVTPIWIDGICIHQKNDDERVVQVQMMGRIYHSAKSVIVWLGKGDPLLRRAMKWIETNFEKKVVQRPPDSMTDPKHLFRVEIEELLARLVPEHRSKLTLAETLRNIAVESSLPYLFLGRWFTRVWVLQEAILAQELTFALGDCVVSDLAMYQGLGHALEVQRGKALKELRGPQLFQDYSENQLVHLHSVRVMFELRFSRINGGEKQDSLLEQMLLGWNRRSTDTRDKVFGILGLTDLVEDPDQLRSTGTDRNATPAALVPDYNKEVKDIFIQCSRCILSADECLTGLSLCRGVAPAKTASTAISWVEASRKWQRVFGGEYFAYGVDGIPSWAIDFTVAAEPRPLVFSYEHAFSAGRIIKATTPIFGSTGSVLHVKAHNWDEVQMVGEDSSIFQTFGYHYFSGDILRLLSRIGHTYEPTNESTLRAFALTITANHPAVVDSAKEAFLQEVGGIEFLNWLVNVIERAIRKQSKPSRWNGAAERMLKNPVDTEQQTRQGGGGRKAQEARLANAKEAWDEFLQKVDRDGHVQDTIDVVGRPNKLDSFYIVWRYIYDHRRLFLTKKGYLGIGPRTLEVEDSIMVIPGAAVPFAIRKEGDNWLMIGETYVHGIMNNEAIIREDVSLIEVSIK
ncbi:hypothetical protein GP486_006687 [Trichoglossum hirsutum]|uniref:Heterokaryon incompatibility domain-containing protein n=1 Tax=Trichoglossum hirsutum TaxID=265104 RepID=A0A9P8IGX6_9PEZI|nr:hypothetical protein GP486_006687 [Trichoglossum hirsutum]